MKSAIKRDRQSEKVAAQNQRQVSAMRTAKKKFIEAAEAGNEDAAELYKNAVQAIDKAAQRGLIHKNKASRDKASLAKKLAQ